MGTHPIFESDFDCLTESHVMALYYAGRIAVPSTSKTTLHDRFTKFMKNRPSKLDVIATPARASERNQRLAAEMESRDSVKSAIRDNRKWGKSNHQAHFQPYQHHRPNNQKGKASTSDSKKSKSKKSKNKSNEKNEKDDEGNRKKQK